jgi:superfamily II DNA or RNA helicase
VVDEIARSTVRHPALEYGPIVEEYRKWGIEFEDNALKAPPSPKLRSSYQPRDYQAEGVEAWARAGRRGIVVLPTGAGKTVLAVKAMEALGEATLVVVPTIVLLEQWLATLREAFGVEVGAVGGGFAEVLPVTVATYESAALRAAELGDKFGLIVFDEVHHLPAPSNSSIALKYLAPHRLGLTATLGKDEEALATLERLVGPVVYERGVEDLAGRHLSEYVVRTIQVPLSPGERLEYERQYAIYRSFLQSRGIVMRGPRDYLAFVKRSGRDPEARRALMARNSAMDIALNSRAKEEYLRGLLASNTTEKTIIFTRHNKLVYRISRDLLIPAITHQTPREEREEILGGFRSGTYRRVVTSQVLDEGIDVPDASLAIILSGTGSSREFIQRLGRVLRKREGKQAALFELVSLGTAEGRLARRRKGE